MSKVKTLPPRPPAQPLPQLPSPWRRLAPKPAFVRKPCGLCNRVRAWIGIGPTAMSNAPLADRLQHAETIEPPRVDASSFRQGWLVRTRLDGLRLAGRISVEVWQAAVEYRDAWGRVGAGRSVALGGTRISGGCDVHDRQIGLVDTMADLTRVERRIGPPATLLVYHCAVNDLSWPEIGRRIGRSNHTAMTWTVLALRALALAWATRRPGGRALGRAPPEPQGRVRPS
jgi:hypothetical protein